jgi:hypothetical protein
MSADVVLQHSLPGHRLYGGARAPAEILLGHELVKEGRTDALIYSDKFRDDTFPNMKKMGSVFDENIRWLTCRETCGPSPCRRNTKWLEKF